jgi:helix-turn-helix protein
MQDDDPLYDTKAAAAYLGRKPSTLIWWRHIGRGPKYAKPEGRITYRKSWLDEHTQRGIVDPRANASRAAA